MKGQWQRIAKHLPDIRIGDPVLIKSTADKLDEYLSRIEALEAENARLRAALRVNALRWGYSHEDVDEIIARAALKQEGGE